MKKGKERSPKTYRRGSRWFLVHLAGCRRAVCHTCTMAEHIALAPGTHVPRSLRHGIGRVIP